MKFPKRLRHRGKVQVLATIYRRPDGYRLHWRARVDGKPCSQIKDFSTYSEAKRQADKIVSDKAKGAGLALAPGQVADAQNAIDELQRYFQATGKRVSIRDAVGQFCANSRKLGERPLSQAVDGFLSTVAGSSTTPDRIHTRFSTTALPRRLISGSAPAETSPGTGRRVP